MIRLKKGGTQSTVKEYLGGKMRKRTRSDLTGRRLYDVLCIVVDCLDIDESFEDCVL